MMIILSNIFTFLTAFFIFLNSFFYPGFVKKHFIISAPNFLFFYLVLISCLYIFKKISISQKLIKLNKICFPILIGISLLFFLLEQYTYPNFVYGHFHINSNNFIWLVFLSGYIFYLYKPKKLQKHFYFIFPLLAVFLSKKISFDNNFDIELTGGFTHIILNSLLWFFVLLFFVSIFKKRSSSIAGFLFIFFLFNLVNYYKIKSWNQPVSFGDIYLIDSFKEFTGAFLSSGKTILQISISIAIITFLIFIIKKFFNQPNPKLVLKIKLIIISIFFLTIPVTFPNLLNQTTSWLKIKPSPANQLDYCRDNGILFCFYNDLQNSKTKAPSNYSQSAIKEIYSNLPNNNYVYSNQIKPNIIVILSEALFDSTQLPIKLSQDPIPNIRQDEKAIMISPQFGGGTANVEFEVATGLSNYFMKGKVPYSQSIHQDIPTIFTLFKEQGYTTTAIHPYLRSMFNRTSVYKHFGVDKFISIEDISDYEKTGAYVSDKSFTQEILKQFNSTDQPQLIFTLSMQNHYPFEGHRFPKNPIQFSDSLTPSNHESLETYINGTYYSDQAYLLLKQELKKSSKPTVIIFYGDHLPLLGTDSDIYKTLGFVPQNQSEWGTSEYQKMYSTPIAIWSNYKTNTDIKYPILSPNFLSLEILNLANIIPKYQFKFIDSLQKNDFILSQNYPSKLSTKQISQYELIQYDLIYGKQYTINSI